MPMGLAGFDPTLLTLAAIFGTMALSLGATLAWGVFRMRAERLPAATRYDDIRERLALKQVELAQIQLRIHELEQKEHERDRLAAEVQVLEQRLGEFRLEWENLAAAREEIAKVKAEAAEAAQEKAEAEQGLRALREEAERLSSQLDPEHIAGLRRAKEEVERELDRLRGNLGTLRAESEAALRIIAEARTGEARVEALRIEVEALKEEVSRLGGEREPLTAAVAEARGARDAARRTREEAEQDLERANQQRTKLVAEVATLEALRDKLAKEVRDLGDATGGTGELTEEQRRAMLADIVAMPACLEAPEKLRGARPSESAALHEVATYLQNCGLEFTPRTLRAFHTALKINDAAQLTVLAGVSGTGKSLLPRRYAEAMGIHFLQVAVEPRWDSPQDLLGFYNYIEQKYRATELARLLAHLDPWRSLDLAENSPERRDHMALVLLDEMNLARVEYYFSEFLSRLEARPAWRPNLTPEVCKDAVIPVDIRGLEDAPRLFPTHNILFVGTMNDDESTQSLSDKVLDRANVLQFPAPREFPPPAQGHGKPSSEAQSFGEWRSWVHPAGSLREGTHNLAREAIGELGKIMQGFGRPFGHRLNQSILTYVANYPAEHHAGIDPRIPLADQIELRILPKLRGVEIDSHRDKFEQLEHLIRTRLDDAALAQRISEAFEDQSRGSGLFVWRGIMREV